MWTCSASRTQIGAVNRDDAAIYLCQGDQGQPGTWAWIGVEDVAALHEVYTASGANIRCPPQNYPWAYLAALISRPVK
jgi:hypothetical protein